MDSYKLAVKFFIQDASQLNVKDFVPVFHRWIQQRALAGHQLIDVADYSHVHEGPGTVLVSHEANLHADLGGGRLGLLYVRKQPLPGEFGDRLRATFEFCLRAAAMLEDDPTLAGRVRFGTGEAIFRIHDRLHAPNSTQTFAELRPQLESFLKSLYAAPAIELDHRADPLTLFEVGIRAPQSIPVASLLQRASRI